MNKKYKPHRAYNNLDFLNSSDARTIRILAEYHEPQVRFKKYGINNTIVIFGSARSIDLKKAELENTNDEKYKYKIKLAQYYEDAVKLSKKLTEHYMDKSTGKQTFYVCSGGGPGMMEAANKGAHLAGGKSIGLNVTLPMEQYPNPYITDELNFEFHYFFIRKFWFVYLAKALVIFPGGFGTMDELMECLTLIQTRKIDKKLPILIYGTDFWKEVINLEALVKWGTINKEDLDLFHFSDDVDEAFDYLVQNMGY
jgi:uncharacterized protein (TIGR00730 family)